MNNRAELLMASDASILETEMGASFDRLLLLARQPTITMEVMQELEFLFNLYKKLKKQYVQDAIAERKIKK